MCTNEEKQTHLVVFFPLGAFASASPLLGRPACIPVVLQNTIVVLRWSGSSFSSALQTGEDPEAAVNLIFIINISNNGDGILRSIYSACDAAYARDN